MLCDPELSFSRPAVGPVEGVIARACDQRVFDVDGTAEHLNAVILVEVYLHVIDDRAGANALKRDTVQLVVGTELNACEFDADICKMPLLSLGSFPPNAPVAPSPNASAPWLIGARPFMISPPQSPRLRGPG